MNYIIVVYTLSFVHVECMYASAYSMHCKIHPLLPVAVLLAGTSESDDALSQKLNVSTQQSPRYRKSSFYDFDDINSKYRRQRVFGINYNYTVTREVGM